MTQTSSRPSTGQEGERTAEKKPERRLLVALGAGLVLAAGAASIWWYAASQPPSDRLRLSGRLEGYETDIGAKTAGRVDRITVREGDTVRRGQLVVQLYDDEIQAQLRGANARIASARQQQQQSALQIRVLEGQVRQAELNLQQSRGDAQGRIDQAEAQVATAQAQLAQAQAQVGEARANLKLAQADRNRYEQLAREGVVATQQFDQQQTNFEAAKATLAARQAAVLAARKQVAAASGTLTQTRTTALNPELRNAQLDVTQRQLAQARSQLKASQAAVKDAEATRQQLLAQIGYLNITSPIDGVVTARSVEPGAVVTTGKTVLSLIDLSQIYLRGYVPEGQIGKVRVGQKARVFLDSAPDQPLAAHVGVIDPQASFTPENIYFKDERVRQVFGVKILLDRPGGFAKPGMPADGEILLEESK
ncbi:HlyD family secretion protein [Gloeobacter kilaueensis]|uniref:Secretion protein HlyD family protein n=1 Tax=Gloeobacter kilaueensis (strain ATCC BAA-2537 / CCAP 1431/1 / ULC 316 / JS1) TaxID=1183438 RepID=U5QF34_GLOK1|nr:efflux RND transporter periplasmic adaptor subunit [Gloeobacter kilaueensis]AGY57572.1 secretion protein HlyD family protein [Gloeobacter kilaueensis JS1]